MLCPPPPGSCLHTTDDLGFMEFWQDEWLSLLATGTGIPLCVCPAGGDLMVVEYQVRFGWSIGMMRGFSDKNPVCRCVPGTCFRDPGMCPCRSGHAFA